MSGGSKKSKSTSSTTQTLNPWSQNKYENQFNNVQGLIQQNPVQNYEGPMVAGLSDREQKARTMYEGNMGSFNPGFDKAQGLLDNSGRQADFGAVADKYMNPYQTQVLDVLQAQSGRANDEMLAQSRERALANRAYGGSGQGVAEALTNEASQRNLNEQMAGLLYSGYNDARGYYGQDIATDERQAGMTADLAAKRYNMNASDIAGLNNYGEVDRGIQQDTYGAAYQEFLRQQAMKDNQINQQMGLLGSIPMLTNTSGTSTTTEKSNPGVMGVLGAGAGIASMFVPGAQGIGLGLLSGGMSKMSNPSTSGLHG